MIHINYLYRYYLCIHLLKEKILAKIDLNKTGLKCTNAVNYELVLTLRSLTDGAALFPPRNVLLPREKMVLLCTPMVLQYVKSLCSVINKQKTDSLAFRLQANYTDGPCGQLVRVPGYGSRGPGFCFGCSKIFCEVVGLEWGPLSLVRIYEEPLE
jgi:hypothetical protein